jgi:hypothetical protein
VTGARATLVDRNRNVESKDALRGVPGLKAGLGGGGRTVLQHGSPKAPSRRFSAGTPDGLAIENSATAH